MILQILEMNWCITTVFAIEVNHHTIIIKGSRFDIGNSLGANVFYHLGGI